MSKFYIKFYYQINYLNILNTQNNLILKEFKFSSILIY